MKSKKLYIIFIAVAILIGSCTSEFEEFKVNKLNLVKEDVSAKFFFTNTQVKLWVPPFWDFFWTSYLFGQSMAGYTGHGFKQHWENGDALFNDQDGWKSNYTWDYYSGYFSRIDLFLKAVEPGGDFENEKMYAVGEIMKGAYFATFTDMFGEIPFSEVGVEGILLPKFNEQKDIYKGIIDLLNDAMTKIGDATRTGLAVNDLSDNDIVFKGDLQKWKAYANCLKLRIALKAKGAPGADFADAAITSALNGPFITENVQIVKDLTADKNAVSGTSGDIIQQYKNSARRKVSSYMVNFLQDNNDPRLSAYVMPIAGGDITFSIPTSNPDRAMKIINFLIDNLKRAGLTDQQIGRVDQSDKVTIKLLKNAYYVGIPLRFHDNVKAFADFNLFSNLAEPIEGKYTLGREIPQVIFPVAEMYLLRAEAAVLGFGGDADALFKSGIKASFDQWGVADNGYLSSAKATLTGTKNEKLEKIGMQLWAALFMVDFQGWAVARDFDLPLIKTPLTDGDLYSLTIPLGGLFPERMKYGTTAYSLNGANTNAAVARQGADEMATKLWFAKGSK